MLAVLETCDRYVDGIKRFFYFLSFLIYKLFSSELQIILYDFQSLMNFWNLLLSKNFNIKITEKPFVPTKI